jgi:hypothetical protein
VLIAAPVARGDGDPASDVLYTQWLFVPFNAPIPKPDVDRLQTVIQRARTNGYPVRVALIGAPADLGSAFTLWGKPQQYAQFLGQELQFLYKGRLLIVMPNGYGFSRGGKHTAEASALDRLKVTPGAVGLADSAIRAVARLAARSGHPVAIPPKAKRSSSSIDRIIIVVAAIVVLAALAAFGLRKRIWRAAPHTE